MAKEMKVIDVEIKAIAAAGKKLDDRIQKAGIDVLEHFAEHKDTGLVNRLYLALSRGARKTAMASWLLAYCAVVPNTDPKTKADQPFIYDKTKKTDPLAAAQDAWYDHKPDATPDEVFDLQKAVKALLAKAGKAGSIKGGDGETLKGLAALVGIPESAVPTLPTARAEAEADPLEGGRVR